MRAVSAQNANAVPLLRADERPTKVKPDQPGGMAVPDQNVSLYNEKLAKSPVEKLLPPPEQPLPRPQAPAIKPVATPRIRRPRPRRARRRGHWPSPRRASASAAPPRRRSRDEPRRPAAPPGRATGRAENGCPGLDRATGGRGAGPARFLRSPEAAREEWQRLKRANGDLLGNLRANAVSVDLGEKGIYYRIMAGPLDEAAAERLCSEMKERNHGCIIAR